MPKATFYTHVSHTGEFACRLSIRAIRDGGRVLIWSDSETEIARLDRDLWQNDPQSFVPHEIWQPNQTMPSETPLLLASGAELPELPAGFTVLNLSPDFWSIAPVLPARVLEIVGDSFEELADARERFKAYRRHGFEIEHFNMQNKA